MTNIISKEQNDKITKIINIGVSYCKLKCSYVRVKIVKKNAVCICLENGIIFNSKDLAKFLAHCDDIFLIGVTAGSNIVEYRDNLLKEEKLTESVIIDAVGSEMAEAMANWLHGFLDKYLNNEGKYATKRRYSPGYGDFELANQQDLFALLELERIGVSLSSNFIMNPEKSITAIIGIRYDKK